MRDKGLKLLEILKEQRKHFIRLADGTRRITNHILYNALEDEAEQLQREIGKNNMKKICV